ncbi:MAG: hypothetical protein IJL69_02800, partial [Oscillospiraceae bacterium]|nr:hypothetical protein [Oscillospiraceae bacterium]
MAQKTNTIYSDKNGTLFLKTESGGIALDEAVRVLYASGTEGVEAQVARAAGTGVGQTPQTLMDQYAAARRTAAAAAANVRLEEIGSAAAAADAGYDRTARSLYAQDQLAQRAAANGLASAGLYRSGYSDTVRLGLQNQYAADLAANEAARRSEEERWRLERLGVLSDLAVENAAVDEQLLKLGLGQYNTDREFAFRQSAEEYQRGVEQRKLASAERKAALDEAYAAAEIGDFSRLEALGLDTAAARTAFGDEEAMRRARLDSLAAEERRAALADAYAAAEIGDFSGLEALGVDTTAAKAAYLDAAALQKAKLDSAAAAARRTALDEAYDAAKIGDFSGLEALGVDTTAAKAAYLDAAALQKAKLDSAAAEARRAALDEAYDAAKIGDFSPLEALGVDTASARTAYLRQLDEQKAKLELTLLQLEAQRSAAAGAGGTGPAGTAGS